MYNNKKFADNMHYDIIKCKIIQFSEYLCEIVLQD